MLFVEKPSKTLNIEKKITIQKPTIKFKYLNLSQFWVTCEF
jgi:hypothetical protein